MGDNSAIEWTDASWNPVTGCSKVSPGCAHCYAETVAGRFWPQQYVHTVERGFISVRDYHGERMDGRLREFTDVMCHEDRLDQPLRWKQPRRVFVNSMSDLFHEDVPDEFIDKVFAVMALSSRHTFQVLTKRADRMLAYMDGLSRYPDGHCWDRALRSFRVFRVGDTLKGVDLPLPNVWLGTSVENQRFADERIPLLLQTPAAVRFISAEPLLGPVDIGMSSATCRCCQRWSSRWVNVYRTVRPEFPICLMERARGVEARAGIHRAESNPHGALAVGGMGLVPDDFSALPKLDWCIVGGESGPGARPMRPEWARSLRDQCQAAGVPFFFKQWGAWMPALEKSAGAFSISDHERIRIWPEDREVSLRVGKKIAGRLLDGQEWSEFPQADPFVTRRV